MGYRSEVRIATTREGYDRVCAHVDALSSGGDSYPLIGTKQEPEFFDEQDGSVVFGWDWIKWYDGQLADVTNVSDALSEIADAGIPYEFCRVGESWDDIEFHTANDNEALALHVEPSVAIDIISN